jgi:hypothetical protein
MKLVKNTKSVEIVWYTKRRRDFFTISEELHGVSLWTIGKKWCFIKPSGVRSGSSERSELPSLAVDYHLCTTGRVSRQPRPLLV